MAVREAQPTRCCAVRMRAHPRQDRRQRAVSSSVEQSAQRRRSSSRPTAAREATRARRLRRAGARRSPGARRARRPSESPRTTSPSTAADRGARSRRGARPGRRGRGPHGLQARRRADVRAVEGQARQPATAGPRGRRAGPPLPGELPLDSARAEHRRGPARERGHRRGGPGPAVAALHTRLRGLAIVGDARGRFRATSAPESRAAAPSKGGGSAGARAAAAPESRAAAAPRPGWRMPTAPPLTTLLVRHGQTVHSVERRFSGASDPPLTDRAKHRLGRRPTGSRPPRPRPRLCPPRCGGPAAPRS